jgi:2-polyprenyl-3-methyl-5-hydroxy-6-metoxy-1,4-benzoquinol methylase
VSSTEGHLHLSDAADDHTNTNDPSPTNNGSVRIDPNDLVEIGNCMLCGSEISSEMFRDGQFRVVRCADCQMVWVTPRLKPEVLPSVYNEGYWESTSPKDRGYADYRRAAPLYIKTFRKRYSLIEKFAGTKGRTLDIGCAAGFFLKVMKDKGWEVSGVELSPEIAAYARDTFDLEDIFVGTLDEAPHQEKSFDLVTMWDVIEHIAEPLPFLKRAASLLKDTGCLILETQNVDSRFAKRLGPRWHHYKHLEHLYHFNPKTIERLLDQAGLEIVHLTPRFGGKHVSLGFIRERATRVHGVMKYLLAPLAPLSGMSFYVNMRDEMVIVARKKK